MSPGTTDLLLLILVFLGLQVWWIIPLIKNNIKINESDKELRKKFEYLEKLYKK